MTPPPEDNESTVSTTAAEFRLRCSRCRRLVSVLLVVSREDSLVAQINTAVCRSCADHGRGH